MRGLPAVATILASLLTFVGIPPSTTTIDDGRPRQPSGPSETTAGTHSASAGGWLADKLYFIV